VSRSEARKEVVKRKREEEETRTLLQRRSQRAKGAAAADEESGETTEDLEVRLAKAEHARKDAEKLEQKRIVALREAQERNEGTHECTCIGIGFAGCWTTPHRSFCVHLGAELIHAKHELHDLLKMVDGWRGDVHSDARRAAGDVDRWWWSGPSSVGAHGCAGAACAVLAGVRPAHSVQQLDLAA
jgi:hypothetical protein